MLCLPLLAALRRQHLRAPLHFAGVRESAEVLAAFGAADAVLSSEDLQLWALGGDSAASQRARERLRQYARVIGDAEELHHLPAGDPVVSVFAPLPKEPSVHAADWILRQLGFPDAKPDDGLLPARMAVPIDPSVLLHPGAGSDRKRWPRPRFEELAQELVHAGQAVTVALGPVELERDDPRRWQWPDGTTFVAVSTLALGYQLRSSRACVANDSGPAHLAAALGVPTVAVFGPTDPAVWAPRGNHVRVVGEPTQGPPDAPVASVLAALRDLGLAAQRPA